MTVVRKYECDLCCRVGFDGSRMVGFVFTQKGKDERYLARPEDGDRHMCDECFAWLSEESEKRKARDA